MSGALPCEPLVAFAPRLLLAGLPRALADLPSPEWLRALLHPAAAAPLRPDEGLRAAVRDLLRQRGYRPTGRGKPSSEYLVAAAADGRLGSINAVVDAGNAVSLHSGLPISIVDADRAAAPLHLAVAAAGSTYVFNASGQEIDVAGLPCLFDAGGPCANAVKDAQRTKTGAATRRILAVVWGCDRPFADRPDAAAKWLAAVLGGLGATVEALGVEPRAAEGG
jgi:DNA/RNA-binding domain of Phe-tRNA-synthetase-like protein